jgi:spermidine synthase
MTGGVAALSWEVLWQLHAALAIGVSASGTAITLVALMGGMTAGSLWMGRYSSTRPLANPLRTYGWLELCIGLCGLLLGVGFDAVERLDTVVYGAAPTAAPLIHLLGIVAVVGLPSLAMGASIPVFGLVARQFGTSIAALYGFNTFGAAVGCLLTAFVVLPALGVAHSAILLSTLNLGIFAVTRLPSPEAGTRETVTEGSRGGSSLGPVEASVIVFASGFATFTLEVAWFRAFRAAFNSTTTSFALMLAAVLVPLAAGAALARRLRGSRREIGDVLAGAGMLILLSTPVIERFDMLASQYLVSVAVSRFVFVLGAIGPSVFLLGVVLPLLLQSQDTGRVWARLYAINTAGAIYGALGAAWVLLPTIGFARTVWVVGAGILTLGLLNSSGNRRTLSAVAGVICLGLAIGFESAVGLHRVIGATEGDFVLVEFAETPDSTIAVVELEPGVRTLYIDGFQATTEGASSHYMAWMGRLPMLLHPDPKNALVICFGTGQTANGVRQEGVEHLDVVDVSAAVLGMAGHFHRNQGVLTDPRVSSIRMDGRAWLRRSDQRYDVLTLEPMPPTFAGVNALYSHEFYQLAAARMNPGGVVAQWLPIHAMNEYRARSIAATFIATFPNAVLWIDPIDRTGILVGAADGVAMGSDWPGLEREVSGRDMSDAEIKERTFLHPDALHAYADGGTVITDDNQILAYGFGVDRDLIDGPEYAERNYAVVLEYTGRRL